MHWTPVAESRRVYLDTLTPTEVASWQPGDRLLLNGKLLTGRGSRYLRHAVAGGAGGGQDSDLALWFPPTKVSGRYLSQWLPHLEREQTPSEPPVDVEVAAPAEPHIDVEVPLPSPYELGRRAMTLDPYSPLHH